MDYLKWVIDWFVKNGNSEKELKGHLYENFFDLGYIDSFTFIMLMSDIEEELEISFANDRFQDRSFATIHGFAKALAEEANK
jgi:hypothetical protein